VAAAAVVAVVAAEEVAGNFHPSSERRAFYLENSSIIRIRALL